MGRLENKTAIITGAAKGIGRAVAEAYAAEGANLLLVTRTTSLDEVRDACHTAGATVECMAGDVADTAFAKEVVTTAKEKFGTVDILVNNAGITKDGLLARMKEADFDDVINTNLKGSFNFIQAATKVMMKQRSGSVVNIGSIVGVMGNPGQANYAASKAGIIGLSKAVARELGGRNIRVNVIAPGFIETDMTAALPAEGRDQLTNDIPLARFGTGADVAAAAVYLGSDESAYVTGLTLSVAGGLGM